MTIKYSPTGTFTTAIDGSASTPTLKNLATLSYKLGNAIDLTGSSDRNMISIWQLKVKFTTGPTVNLPVLLYFIKSADGTNYEYGDDSNAPPMSSHIATFVMASNTNSQIYTIDNIAIPNCKFKPMIYNGTNQGFTNVDADNILSYEVYDLANT